MKYFKLRLYNRLAIVTLSQKKKKNISIPYVVSHVCTQYTILYRCYELVLYTYNIIHILFCKRTTVDSVLFLLNIITLGKSFTLNRRRHCRRDGKTSF